MCRDFRRESVPTWALSVSRLGTVPRGRCPSCVPAPHPSSSHSEDGNPAGSKTLEFTSCRVSAWTNDIRQMAGKPRKHMFHIEQPREGLLTFVHNDAFPQDREETLSHTVTQPQTGTQAGSLWSACWCPGWWAGRWPCGRCWGRGPGLGREGRVHEPLSA